MKKCAQYNHLPYTLTALALSALPLTRHAMKLEPMSCRCILAIPEKTRVDSTLRCPAHGGAMTDEDFEGAIVTTIEEDW
jgi:hypothetical protein